jgi:hypothetical protein
MSAPPLPRVTTRCVPLNPNIWGFDSRAEMDAFFAREDRRVGPDVPPSVDRGRTSPPYCVAR